MSNDLHERIDLYAWMVGQFPAYREHYDLSAALIRRDEIHDELLAGAPLAAPDAVLLEDADRRYASMRAELSRRFPEVYDGLAPRDYWWWYVDEAPRPIADELLIGQST